MKALHVTTDFYDEVHHTHRFYEQRHLQALMAYCRSLGATTIDWILDDMWALYDDYPGGLDLLRCAIDAAHKQGMRFHVVYKPFEGGLVTVKLPQSFPRPAGAVVWEDLRGLIPIVRPFNVAHPEMCLRRRPGDEDPGGAVRTIRLFAAEPARAGVEAGDVSIWTGEVNGRWDRYEGDITVNEKTQWRPLFPLGLTCGVVELTGLDIPAGRRYVEVRFADGAFGGSKFRNEYDQIVELVNERGEVIPSTPAACRPLGPEHVERMAQPWMLKLVRYGHAPEVQAFLADVDAAKKQAAKMRDYVRAPQDTEYRLDERRRIAVARGKPPYLFNVLNPVYLEVRAEWLRAVRYCIDRGADAVDFRASRHGRVQETLAYGFNQPVLRALDGEADAAAAARIMGDAYTAFLREARDLLHAHGRRIGVHLLSNFLRPRDEWAPPHHENVDYQWETWVAEIADFATFRGAMGFREDSLRYVVDRFARACREAEIPLVYQSNRRIFTQKADPLHLDPDRLEWLRREMAWALGRKDISAYQLYETASFTHLDESGTFHGSEEVLDTARRFGFAQA